MLNNLSSFIDTFQNFNKASIKYLRILTLLRFNWEIFVENIRNFLKCLSSYYKIFTQFQETVQTNLRIILINEGKNENIKEGIGKLTNILTVWVRLIVKSLIHLLGNSAIIKKLKIFLSRRGGARPGRGGNASPAPLWLRPWGLEIGFFL